MYRVISNEQQMNLARIQGNYIKEPSQRVGGLFQILQHVALMKSKH